MNVKTEMTIQLRQIDAATGRIVSESKPQKNLMMDGGLNALAKSTNSTTPAGCFAGVRVGSGSTSDKTASGAITFTQAGTTITASAPFFGVGMIGYIFKYGTGTAGAEYYITGYTDTTHVTVDTSATVGTPTVATVWNVTRTTLETLLYSSSTYETTAGSCGTTFSANLATHKRTVNFPTQASPYNVNEVGYFNGTGGTTIFGRLVLAATEVVAPTNFLQIVLSLAVTYSPGAPTAVADVGTTINTAGNAMLEGLAASPLQTVTSLGTINNAQNGSCLDGSTSVGIGGIIASYSQNLATAAAAKTLTCLPFNLSNAWAYNSVRGQMKVSANTTISTAGQTLYGVMLGLPSANTVYFDVNFTSTYALPTGSFLPQVTFLQTYNRVLNN